MTETTEDIATIGWTLATIAARLKVPVNTVKGWKHRDAWPEPVRRWLHAVAEAHRNIPTPSRKGRKPGHAIDWNDWLNTHLRETVENV